MIKNYKIYLFDEEFINTEIFFLINLIEVNDNCMNLIFVFNKFFCIYFLLYFSFMLTSLLFRKDNVFLSKI